MSKNQVLTGENARKAFLGESVKNKCGYWWEGSIDRWYVFDARNGFRNASYKTEDACKRYLQKG